MRPGWRKTRALNFAASCASPFARKPAFIPGVMAAISDESSRSGLITGSSGESRTHRRELLRDSHTHSSPPFAPVSPHTSSGRVHNYREDAQNAQPHSAVELLFDRSHVSSVLVRVIGVWTMSDDDEMRRLRLRDSTEETRNTTLFNYLLKGQRNPRLHHRNQSSTLK